LRSWVIDKVAAVLFLVAAGSAPAARDAPPEPLRKLVIIYTGDSGAEIESCGCSALAFGGLARRATLVNLLRREYADALFVDAGDFFSPAAGEQDRLKDEIMAAAYGAAGYDAVNLGEDELNFGPAFLLELVEAHSIPWVSANVYAGGERVAPAYAVIERGGLRLGVVGFVNPELAAGKDLGGAELRPYKKALKVAARELKEKADVVICLAHVGNVEKARRFAAECPKEIDVVIAGHRGGRTPRAEKVKGRWLVYTRSRNRYVGMLELEVDDGNRLAAATNTVLPVTKETAKDEETQKIVDRYYAALKSLVAEAGLLAKPARVPAGGFVYVGADACAPCHAAQLESWRASRHAGAYATLEQAGREMDPDCVRCHVTGYGYRGGFDIGADGADRRAVGCEECHGPGEGHARAPELPTAAVEAASCVKCHDAERSPAFDFERYRAAVVH
jgi:2',3'-cyclic-nucleotide 2'-phosphodiesterase (5'-nucleotidase family)